MVLNRGQGKLFLKLLDKRLDAIDSALRTAGLGDKHLAILADDKDTALDALGALLETNGTDEGKVGVAEQGVLQLLLGVEGGVGLGGVGAEAIDGEAVGSEGLVLVAKGADLLGA